MRVYQSVCPGCNQLVERGYGEMGEGLVYEKGCVCRTNLAMGDWIAIAMMVAICLILALR